MTLALMRSVSHPLCTHASYSCEVRDHIGFFSCFPSMEDQGQTTHPTPGPSKPRRVRRPLTLSEKLEVIKKVEAGEKKTVVGRLFNVNESTVRTIFGNREAIKASVKAFGTGNASSRKTVTPKCVIVMERLLEEYIRRQESNHMPVSASTLRAQAAKFFKVTVAKYPPSKPSQRTCNFKASSGWLTSFIRRKKLKNVKFTGERATADEVEAEKYPDILAWIITDGEYTSETIFNMDETGLMWKKMPKSTYVFKSTSQARGRKTDKNRFTTLLCVNASGSCKMKPFVVHQAAKPHAYRHLQSMDNCGVYWRKGGTQQGRGKAWMSGSLTTWWFDKCFVPDARRHCRRQEIPFKVILLLDNATCHPKHLIGRHRCVRVEFLPANTTSLLQPLDQEVISNLKFFYQRRVYTQLLRSTDTEEEIQRLEEEEETDDDVMDVEDDDDEPPTSTTTATNAVATNAAATNIATTSATNIATTSATTTASTSVSVIEDVTSDVVNITQFWKKYNIRHAVNNLLASWAEVSVATINHSWRRIAPQLYASTCAPQCVDESAGAVVSVARTVPGCGEVTVEEVMEVARDIEETAVQSIFEEVEQHEREEVTMEEEAARTATATVRGEPTSEWISGILSTVNCLEEQLLEDPSLGRGQAAIQKLMECASEYKRIHSEGIVRKKQAVITSYFARQADMLTAEERQREEEEEVDDDVASVISEVDFEGF